MPKTLNNSINQAQNNPLHSLLELIHKLRSKILKKADESALSIQNHATCILGGTSKEVVAP